jgi:hypothetical protein
VVAVAERIVIDPAKVRPAPGNPSIPSALDWWQRFTPLWVDASQDDAGRVVLTPNGAKPDGRVVALTPAAYRRHLKAVEEFLGSRLYFDFSDAIVSEGGQS